MNRRRFLWAALMLVALALLLSLPAVHWRLIGWVQGEPFYQGRPASFWSAQFGQMSAHYELVGQVPQIECYQADCVLPTLRRRLGLVVPTRLLSGNEVPFGGGDPAGVPVLLAVLRSPHDDSRAYAAWALARIGPPAKEARPELRTLAGRKPRDMLAFTCQNALRYIETDDGREDNP